MAQNIDFISEITSSNQSWSLTARVVRLWSVIDVTNPRLPFSMEMVLMDAKGDRIHASIRRTLLYKFQTELREGSVYSIRNFTVDENCGNFKTTRHAYKITFQFGTKVLEVDGGAVPANTFSFVPVAEIFGSAYDSNYLVDIMGVLTNVRPEREYERNGTKSKMVVIELQADGFKFECALFGPYVDELNSFKSSAEVENVVVAIQFAKVKSFQGKISLQNTMYSTRIFFNPENVECNDFRKRMAEFSQSPSPILSQLQDSSRLNMTNDFLDLTLKRTIQAFRESKEEICYIVFGTVKHIVGGGDWWYLACACNRVVIPDSKMYFCDKCNNHVLTVTPRYRVMVEVTDNTGAATFVIFDRDAAALFNKSCVQMLETFNKAAEKGEVPKDIAELVEKSFLFKVEFKSAPNMRFEQSYCVKKITNDEDIVKRFKELSFHDSENVAPNGCYSHDGGDKLVEKVSDVAVVQELMTKCSEVIGGGSPSEDKQQVVSTNILDTMIQGNGDDEVEILPHLSSKVPVKIVNLVGDCDHPKAPVAKKLKKKIKIEKD